MRVGSANCERSAIGIGDLFGKKTVVCPDCRTRGALKTALGRIRCRNRACSRYDEAAAQEPLGASEGASPSRPVPQGVFDPGTHRIVVRYRNFRGDDTEYVGDGRTIRFRKAHVTLRVAPTGRRIALWQKFVQNLDDLKRAAPRAEATPVERQILGYHTKRRTTSPRFEALRRKYPHWHP